MITSRKILAVILATSLTLLTGCHAKATPSIAATCEAYLQGIKLTQAGLYPNTPSGNKAFFSQLEKIKSLADTSAVPELQTSALAMLDSAKAQDKSAFTIASQSLFNTCAKYGFNSLR